MGSHIFKRKKERSMNESERAKHLKMMVSGEGHAVVVTTETGKTSIGQVRIIHWDKRMRTSRALKFWGYCFGLSIVSIIIPLAHFVLVPGFFLAGPIGAWMISTRTSQVLGGESTCPECSAFLPLAPSADHWPLNDLCTGCQRSLKVKKMEKLGEL